jgi:hypothetical protein
MESNSNLNEHMYHLENHVYNLEEQVEQNRRMMRNFNGSVDDISEKISSVMRVVFELQSRLESLESEQTGEFVTKRMAPTAKPVAPTAKPVAPTAKPVAPTAKPVAPTAKPIAPTAKPVAPAAASTTLKSKYAVGLEIPPHTPARTRQF